MQQFTMAKPRRGDINHLGIFVVQLITLAKNFFDLN